MSVALVDRAEVEQVVTLPADSDPANMQEDTESATLSETFLGSPNDCAIREAPGELDGDDVTEMAPDGTGLVRRIGAAVLRPLRQMWQYGPAVFLGVHADNAADRASLFMHKHPSIAVALGGLVAGALGARMGVDLVHQATTSGADSTSFTVSHMTRHTSAGAKVMTPPRHTELTAALRTAEKRPQEILRPSGRYVAEVYAKLPGGLTAMQEDAARAQAAGVLRIIYPDGYLPNGQPVNPNHFWYAVRETYVRNGMHVEVWYSDEKHVLPTLATHSNGARVYQESTVWHSASHSRLHQRVPSRKKRNPGTVLSDGGPVDESLGDDAWLFGAASAVAASGSLLLKPARRRARAVQHRSVEIQRSIVDDLAIVALMEGMATQGIIEIAGTHKAPFSINKSDQGLIHPQLGRYVATPKANTKKQANPQVNATPQIPTRISARVTPDMPDVITFRVSMPNGDKIGRPIVVTSSGEPEDPASVLDARGYTSIICTLNRADKVSVPSLQGETDDGQLEDILLRQWPLEYFLKGLGITLKTDLINATSSNTELAKQAASKEVVLTRVSTTG
ncbi:MAG TPA: hypothetical protein VMB52_02450 [Verrucomicrobiae bacterium]|nr:hypothetical protein [Verrucomicrobiae bacterium]